MANSQYRSAKGKIVDMAKLISKNETVRAVGNMKVNARGDQLDSRGRVVVTANQRASEKYQRTVSNRAANIIKKPNSIEADAKAKIPTDELLPSELEIENDTDAAEIAAIKAADNKKLKPASEAPDSFAPEPQVKKTK
jgi:hypothetical protein